MMACDVRSRGVRVACAAYGPRGAHVAWAAHWVARCAAAVRTPHE